MNEAMQIIPDATGLISREDQIDAYFISTVNILARKYNIQVEIDSINHIANFLGGTLDQHQRLAQDVVDTLWRYAE